jgi:hypothetical protein
VEKYGRAGQATGYSIIWRMRISCWIAKPTDTPYECSNSYWLPTETVIRPTLLNITFVHISPVFLLEILAVFFEPLMYQRTCESGFRIRASEENIGMILLHATVTFCDVSNFITFRRFRSPKSPHHRLHWCHDIHRSKLLSLYCVMSIRKDGGV